MIATFAGKVVTFLDTYFPNEDTVYAAAESWLQWDARQSERRHSSGDRRA